ncbi:MAG TPA: ATP-binding protein [Terriglobales bacterium]|nr:ATP-binding protein [Terriglobales bacterium]
MRFRFRTIALGLITATLCVLALVNVRQLAIYRQPTDAMLWQRTTAGLQAVARDANTLTPVAVGDRLLAINGDPVATPEDVARALASTGIGNPIEYDIVRGARARVMRFAVQPTHPPLRRYAFLELVGLCYLAIGLFVLYRRQRAPQALRFYLFCLASFALYCFHFTAKLNLFDHTVFWINEAGLLLAPTFLLAYALRFRGAPQTRLPERSEAVSKFFLTLLYLPAILIGLTEIALASGALWVPATLSAVQDLLDRASYTLFAAYFIAAAASFRWKALKPGTSFAVRKQARCMAWGTALAVGPFLVFYIAPFLWGIDLPPYANLSVLSLALVPIAFGYAIWRHHLLEAEVVLRRGVVYTLATAVVVAVYLGTVALAGAVMQSRLPAWGWAGWLFAILVTALLFEPLKQWLQERVDRMFYRERYDFRRTLIEFGRQMNAQPELDPLLDLVLERLVQTLSLDRAAIFLPQEGTRQFSVARMAPVEASTPALDLNFLGRIGAEREFFEYPHGAARSLELHYFVPCRLQSATVAVFGLGKTRQGEFLTSDDLELVDTLAAYFAIALENARLYATLQQKAQQYERLKDFNENIVESIQVGVIAVNLEGRVESWNARMEAITGRPRAAALGQPVAAILGEAFAREFALSSGAGGVHSLPKFRMNAAGGERIFNLAIAPLVTARYQRVGQIVLLSDVTSEVEMEAALSQADRLRSVGLLAAGVAHEVNTPLAVISSYTQMLAKQTPEGDPRAPVLDTITRQTFRASEIISNLLNFSRTGSAAFRKVEINAIVRDTLSLVEHPLRSAAVHVISALHPNPVEVYGDAGKLQQVFLNLILNARDAMPHGGTLRFSTGCDGDHAWVEVADTGDGIADEHLPRLFDPFFTTKAGPRRAGSHLETNATAASLSTGTGLGLAVTYGIIQEHRGTIRVHSQVALGAEFRIELPLYAPAPHSTSSPALVEAV